MTALSDEQKAWFAANPEYGPIGPPRPSVRFVEFGTLYRDGSYVKAESMKPIRLEPGCLGVGIRKSTP